MKTTVQISEKQLKTLSAHKMRYRKPYSKIIEGYQKLIKRYKLIKELDIIMGKK